MKIRTRLTILFTLITASILLVFASIIILSAKKSRESEFFGLLKKEAITKANLFLNAKVDAGTLQTIYLNNRAILNEVEVAIYDTGFNLVYHDAANIDAIKETPAMIREIKKKKKIAFYLNDWQAIGLLFEHDGNDYIVTATAYDQYGHNKLNNLLRNSSILFIVSLLFLYIAGRFFSKRSFSPVKEMTERANRISATNLDLRLNVNDTRDEISELGNTFNEMLSRLENSFEAQKQFVSNISHEIRTPLAAIITELELSGNKERSVPEYKVIIREALTDARKLVKLSNSLLDFAKASYDPSEIAFKQVRIDEVLLDARHQVQVANPDYKINIHFENAFENDEEITVNGNEYLLKTAFSNLFDNGCKFSADHQCLVRITLEDGKITLAFSDHGTGIPADDLKNIFIPFYRGENKTLADGYGIGLSLTSKIISLHNGDLSVTSEVNRGTTFTVVFGGVRGEG
ncbi:HAMP domain-containing sensor histidine kinase [Ravibacter arvi]|uniref:histidine kinase n=1 Tax=Ravibacter arvi TaxID=2051041 RepID=A0ABP8LY96_9BACT